MERAKHAEKLVVAAGHKTKERDFWLEKLSGDWEKTTFACDFIDRIGKRVPGKVEFLFPGDLFAKILKLSDGSDIRIHMILMAGIVVLLHRYSYNNSGDIVLGMPVYKQKIKGEFINTLLTIRTNLEETMSVKELLLRVKDTVIEAVEHRNYPVEILLEKLNLPVSGNGDFPLFDVAVLLENIHDKKDLAHIRHNLTFSFSREGDRHLRGEVIYNRSLYKEETIKRITGHLLNFLQQALRDPAALLCDTDILSEEEKKGLLITFNGDRETLPADGCKSVHRLFSEQAERSPEKIAVSSPYDKAGIYNALAATGDLVDIDLLSRCCFLKNPYMFQTGFKTGRENRGSTGDFKIVKTQQHNSVIVNTNVIKLLDLFDKTHNVAAIYNLLKEIKNPGLKFFILSMSENDLLEVTFRFNDKADIFTLDSIEITDFARLVKILYRNHLLDLVDVVPQVSYFEDLPADFFREDIPAAAEINPGQLLARDKELGEADVLLLGDTPGTPSTGLLYLAGYLRRKGIKVYCRFYDSSRNYQTLKKDVSELLKKIRPRLVAVSMKWFLYISRVFDICRVVKEYARQNSVEIKVVVGGNTASYYSEEIIKNDCIDYLVCGDGEEPLLRIWGGELEIPNCLFKKDGKIVKSPLTYLQDETNDGEIYLSHLDEILLSQQASLFGTFFIYTHKGCAMNCLYCGGCNRAQQKTFNRKNVFRRGIEQVRKDIIEAKEYASTFQFDFDIPAADIVDYCRETWQGIDLSGHFCIFSTLKPPGAQLIELVSRTFKYVYWDFDICTLSGRHRRELVSKGLVKPLPADEEILHFLHRCEKYENIEVRINLITGLPYFTIADIESSEKLLAGIMNRYKCFGELHWARLHAQPGAPVIRDAGKYGMHSYAESYSDFLEYSRKNFDRQADYPGLEYLNYPYIYFRDEKLNSQITRFYSENNLKIEQHRQNRRENLLSRKDLSYRELDTKSDHLAGLLRGKGVSPGSVAALMLEPSVDTAVSILGILKTGAAYLPIDPEFPPGRVSYMLKDSNAAVLVTTRSLFNEDEKFSSLKVETVFIEDCRGEPLCSPEPTPPFGHPSREGIFQGRGEPCVRPSGKPGVGARRAVPSEPATCNLQPVTSPLNAAYVIYTSGSTGKPKGVILSHKNLTNYVNWFSAETGLSEKDKTVLTSSFAFDLGYTAIYPSLLKGGELHIPGKQDYLLPERMLQYITENEITYIKVTPSLFSLLVNCPDFTGQNCESLRLAVLGGEPINLKDIEKTNELYPHIKIMNHYGPTEATIGCVATFVDFDRFAGYKENPVIGKPIFNTGVYILGKNLNLLPVGAPGELCITGCGIAHGYLNRPDLTSEKFVTAQAASHKPQAQARTHQLINSSTHALVYRTGDLARRLPDGNIEFLGRTDNQVKVRGYRIELEEITKRLLAHPGVEEAVVVDREQDAGGKYLCAYLVEKTTAAAAAEDKSLTGIISRLKALFGDGFTGQAEEDENPGIVKGFAEQVQKNPGKTAVTSEQGHLTYDSLDSWAGRAADKIREEYDDRFSLSVEEKERYKRQILLHDWGTSSQEKLKSTTVFVAGAGGGASPTIVQLALAGIGRIKVCDFDEVELSNLNRQFLHDYERIGMNKALSCQQTVAKINPHVTVIPYTEKLTRENVFEMVGDSAMIFDMLDGLADKFILSECAAVKGIPHLILAMVDLNAYTALLKPPDSPCYHCLFDRDKFAAIVDGMQSHVKNYEKNPLAVASSSLFIPAGILVNEALKIILGFENPAYNRFLYFNHRGSDRNFTLSPRYQSMIHLFSDHFLNLCREQGFDWQTGWRGKFLEEFTLAANPGCPLCGEKGREKRETLRERMQKSEPVSSLNINDTQQSATAANRARQTSLVNKKAVALLSDSAAAAAAGIIAALRSAKSYVLLAPEENENRLIDILEDSQARIILTHNRYFALAEKLRDTVNKNIRVIDIASLHDFDDTEDHPETGTTSLTTELREYLLKELPDYMIPAYFVMLPEMPLTGNGKIDRKALPEPGKSVDDEYAPPTNKMEEMLVEAWQEILGVKRIGTRDNFFELGLDSIKAIQVSSRLLQMGLKMEVRDIFENPTIGKLAAKVSISHREINQDTVQGDVPLTPIQQWFFKNTPTQRHHFNMAVMLFKEDGFEKEIVAQVFRSLTTHHDALRMAYEFKENSILQKNRGAEANAFDMEVIDIANNDEIGWDEAPSGGTESVSSTAEEIEKEANRLQGSLDLENGPLIKLGLFKTGAGDHLLIVVHHLLTDGISMRILLEDFRNGYYRAQAGEEPVFPAKTDSYKSWAEKLAAYSTGRQLLKELEYWGELLAAEVKSLPKDKPAAGKERKNIKNEPLSLYLDEKETGTLLTGVNRAYNTGINDILLTALTRSLYEWRGIDKAFIDLEGHGREDILKDINISRTVGWFTSQYPVLLETHQDLAYNIKSVKETLRKIPNKGIGYGILRYLTPGEKKKNFDLDRDAEISFNYLGQFGQEQKQETGSIGISPVKPGETSIPGSGNPYVLKISGAIMGKNLVLYFTADRDEYEKESIEQLTACYKSNLIEIINHCSQKEKIELTPSDLGYSGISLADLQKIAQYAAESAGKPVELEALYPLTPGQQAFLNHTLENKAQRTQSILYLYGTVDHELFQRAFDLLVQRYDVLRTLFFYEDLPEPIQVVLKEKDFKVHLEDISVLPEEEKQEKLEQMRKEDWDKGFDPGKELIRVTLIKFAEKKHYIFWTIHRNIVDGWSIGLLFRDFLRYYISVKEDNPIDLPPVTPYQKYVHWIRNLDREEGLAYWREYLAGYKKPALLPEANKPEKPGKFSLGEQEFILDEKITGLLNRQAKENKVTLNTLIQAAWGILLQRYNNTKDVVFGATVSGRSPEVENIENMVGLFVNSVPVRVNSDSAGTFSQLLAQMQEKGDRARPHEYIPTVEIMSLSPLKRKLLDSNMTFQNYPFRDQLQEMEQDMKKKNRSLDTGFAGGYSNFHVQTNFAVNIFVRPRGMSTAVEFSFNAHVYRHKVVKKVMKDFRSLIMQILEYPDIPLDEIKSTT